MAVVKKVYGTILFHNGFRVFLWSSITSQIFLIYILLTIKQRPFQKKFEICLEIHFVSWFFLNETNIKTSFLMIHLKCTVVHHTNLNSRSINKPYLRTVENALSCFFYFFYMFVLTRLLSKTLWKSL